MEGCEGSDRGDLGVCVVRVRYGCVRGVVGVWQGCGRGVVGVWQGCGRGVAGVLFLPLPCELLVVLRQV